MSAPRPYAEASRRPGELRIAEAAQVMEVHEDTVRKHALEVLAGSTSPRIASARRDGEGRIWIPVTAIRRLAKDPDAYDDPADRVQ